MNKKLLLAAIISLNILVVAAAAPADTRVIADHRRVTSSLADEFDDLMKDAYAQYLHDKYDEALANCSKASKIRPDDYRPYYVSGAVYMAQGKMKDASEAFAKAILLDPTEKGLYVSKSRVDRLRNARNEAVVAARGAIKIDPKYAEAYIALGDALSIGVTTSDEIRQAYRTAIDLEPRLLNAFNNVGMRLYGSKDYKGAEAAFRKVMNLDPNKMVGRYELGRLLIDQGRLAEARELWNGRTSDKDNSYPNFIVTLERAEKKKAAEAALNAKPDDPETLLEMGLAVMEGDSWVVDGRQEKAIVYFKKALAIKPDMARAQYAICMAFVQMADTHKAFNTQADEEIAKLRTMDPKLAEEITQYRKTYSGGLMAPPAPVKK